ncbi:hypothetical protein SESBI_23555 [Sesbania bispinosa]|nr:hypothetical protein SESBI_23555 [Sesbania bispinosa]
MGSRRGWPLKALLGEGEATSDGGTNLNSRWAAWRARVAADAQGNRAQRRAVLGGRGAYNLQIEASQGGGHGSQSERRIGAPVVATVPKNPPPPAKPTPSWNDASETTSSSLHPLLKVLTECARLAETEPDQASGSLIHLTKSVSQHGNPTQKVAFYFSQALTSKISAKRERGKGRTVAGRCSQTMAAMVRGLNRGGVRTGVEWCSGAGPHRGGRDDVRR